MVGGLCEIGLSSAPSCTLRTHPQHVNAPTHTLAGGGARNVRRCASTLDYASVAPVIFLAPSLHPPTHSRTHSLQVVEHEKYFAFDPQPGCLEWRVLEEACVELQKLEALVEGKLRVGIKGGLVGGWVGGWSIEGVRGALKGHRRGAAVAEALVEGKIRVGRWVGAGLLKGGHRLEQADRLSAHMGGHSESAGRTAQARPLPNHLAAALLTPLPSCRKSLPSCSARMATKRRRRSVCGRRCGQRWRRTRRTGR